MALWPDYTAYTIENLQMEIIFVVHDFWIPNIFQPFILFNLSMRKKSLKNEIAWRSYLAASHAVRRGKKLLNFIVYTLRFFYIYI